MLKLKLNLGFPCRHCSGSLGRGRGGAVGGAVGRRISLVAVSLGEHAVHSGALPSEANTTGRVVPAVQVEVNSVGAVRELDLLVDVLKTRGVGAGVAVVAAAVHGSINSHGRSGGEAVVAATPLVVVGADVEAIAEDLGDLQNQEKRTGRVREYAQVSTAVLPTGI